MSSAFMTYEHGWYAIQCAVAVWVLSWAYRTAVGKFPN